MAGYGKEYALNFVDEFYQKLRLPSYRSSYSYWVSDVVNSIPNVTADEYRQIIIAEQTKHAKKLTPALKKEIRGFADSVANRM